MFHWQTNMQKREITVLYRRLQYGEWFEILYGKEENIKDVIVVDLNSTDETKEILEKLSLDYDVLKMTNWRDCKELIDHVDEVK